jgi:hypothetical protein
MRRLRGRLAAALPLVVAVAVVLTGCTSGATDSTDDAPSGSASSAPEPPADDRGEAGAIAFAQYVFEVLEYSYATVDPAPLEQIADLDQCLGCTQPISDISAAAAAGDSLDQKVPLATSDATVVDDTGDRATVQLTVQRPDGTAPSQVTMEWTGSGWTLIDFAPVGN